MKLGRWLLTDLRRLLRSPSLVAAALVIPLLGMLVFSLVLSPMLLSGKETVVKYAICCEDNHPMVRMFISVLAESDSIKGIAVGTEVATKEEGLALLESGECSTLIHVKDGFFEALESWSDPQLDVYAYTDHSFEMTIIRMTMDGALQAVGQSQNILWESAQIAMESGVSVKNAESFFNREMTNAVMKFIIRHQVLGKQEKLSATGHLFPIQYYTGAMFAVFAAFSMLPGLYLSAQDLNGGLRHRGLFRGASAVRYSVARLCSGCALTVLTLALVVPLMSAVNGVVNGYASKGYVIAWWAAIPGFVLLGLCYASLALALGAWCPSSDSALWTGFFLVVAMALVSGVVVSDGALPEFVRVLGRFTPVKTGMNVICSSLYRMDFAQYWQNMAILFAQLCVFSGVAALGIRRKGAAV